MTEEGKRRAKPIIFSTEMVEAILDGRKTRTRRVVHYDIANRFDVNKDGSVYGYQNPSTGDGYEAVDVAPYKIGDILWVRETWATVDYSISADLAIGTYAYVYKASENGKLWESEIEGWKWKSPMFMPKEAARIFLTVVGVWPERLQDITEEDAIKEGISGSDDACYENNGWSPTFNDPDSGGRPVFRDGFRALWNIRNAKRGHGWDENDWVWVYEFEVAEINGDMGC